MRIFVLDDDMQRIKWFKRAFLDEGNSVYYAHDPIEAEEMLRNNEYDKIFLDHDLAGADKPYQRGPKGDGIDLAIIMAKDKIQVDTPVVVHSLNHDGSENMLAALKDTHSNLFRIDFKLLRHSGADQAITVIEHKLKPFYRGK